MIYTNAVILIDSKNDSDSLAKAVRKLTRYLEEERAMEAVFLLDDTVPYPCYLVPEGVAFADIDKALRPHVKLCAINEDIIVLPEKKAITEKYYYTEKELEQMGTSMAAKFVEKKKLEAKKAQIMKEFKADIDALDEQIEELADNHQRGWEEKETPCLVKLNFADKTRYYIEAKDGVRVVSGEPLDIKDYQMRIDVTMEPLHDPTNPDATPEPFLTGDEGGEQLELEMHDDPNDGPNEAGMEDGEYAEGDEVDSPTAVI